MSTDPHPSRPRGLTLIELVMFIVIVSIAVVAVMQVFNFGARNSPDPLRRKQQLALAEGMMDELRLARFTYCDGSDPNVDLPTTRGPADCTVPEQAGPDAGSPNTRPYDNVNDYVTAYGAATIYTSDAAGNPFPAGYAASVTIVQDGTLGPAGAQVPPDAALHLTVSVSYNNGEAVTLDGYRTRYAPTSP